MKVTGAVLLCAAFLVDQISAAARRGIVNGRQISLSKADSRPDTTLPGVEAPSSAPTPTPSASSSQALVSSLSSSLDQASATASPAPASSPGPAPSQPPSLADAQPPRIPVSPVSSSHNSPAKTPSQAVKSLAGGSNDAGSFESAQPSATHANPSSSVPAPSTKIKDSNTPELAPQIVTIVTTSEAAKSSQVASSSSHEQAAKNDESGDGSTTTKGAMKLPGQTSIPGANLDTGAAADALSCPGSGNGSDCLPESRIAMSAEGSTTLTDSATPTTAEEDNRACTPFPFDKPLVQYSIVYTSTVTFYGNASDYTPPYQPIKTPDYCTVLPSTAAPMVTPLAPGQDDTEPQASEALVPDLSLPLPTQAPPIAADSLLTPLVVVSTHDAAKMKGSLITVTLPPVPKILHQVITFITTEKNPAVVFPTESAPSFSQTYLSIPDSFNTQAHHTVDESEAQAAAIATSGPAVAEPHIGVKLPPQPSFAVTAGGNTVIINDNTFTGLQPGQTTTVTVGPATFTLLPTIVEGMGSTITKPAPQGTGTPAPTSRTVGGIPVAVSGSEAIINGTTVQIPSQTTSRTSIGGHDVTLAPGTVAIGTDSLTFVATAPRPTDQVVSGGDLMTVIGRSLVVMGTDTVTYGASLPESTTVVGGDTITIGPSGVDLRGTVLGGPTADAKGTELEIIGGVTVGRLPNSHVVINGQTFTLNARGMSRTALLGGETITIRNDGLVMSSTTIAYPADAYVTATIRPTGTWVDAMPMETGDGVGRAHKSAAPSRRCGTLISLFCFCIATGVGILF